MGLSPRKCLKKQNACTATGQRIDFVVESFSKELVLKVFSFLTLQDLIECAAISLHWSRIANDEMLWKPLFLRRFIDPLHREDKKSQFHYKRRTLVSRQNGSWKKKYRIHHNWLLGKCLISDIVSHSTSLSPNYIQFTQDIMFIAEAGTTLINVWKYENSSSPPHVIHQIQPAEQPDNTQITFLKLIEECSYTKHLIAGYANGGFTLWQVLKTEITEVANYISTVHSDKVVCIGMQFPMILLYTENGNLSLFRINTISSCLKLVHQLQSPMNWSLVAIDIHRYPASSKRDLWKAVLCFGLSGGNYTTSVGIQEIMLSSDAILSSRHAFALNVEPVVVFSSGNNCGSRCSEKITAMTYSPPHLITAHANNTMKHYLVTNSKKSLEIVLKQTLYGHTFRVDALAVDASKRRLVSGDRSGIKIWDLTTQSGECQVTLENYTNQSEMTELPDAKINALEFDEDKIVAILSLSQRSLVRAWSFDM